jgi:glycerate 2-kinase
VTTGRIEVVEAAHPVPDEAGESAAGRILERVKAAGPDDLVLALISGGGSALLTLPAEGVGMAALKETTRALLRCGAAIQEINTVRKHLSAVQGGRRAAASRAPVLALIISDVAGDDPTHIASGPCAPDPTTYADALQVLARHGMQAPDEVTAHLQKGARGELAETPKPGTAQLVHTRNLVIAAAQHSLQAAAAVFREQGVPAFVLGDAVTGEAHEAAKVYAALVRQVRDHGEPWKAPVALLSGGELTVTVRGTGRGGRCSTFLLALAAELDGVQDVHAIACDTDGIDGTEANAGAILGPDTLARAAAAGLSAPGHLAANDSYSFFEKLSDLVVTGPTRTNVNDYRAILLL